MKEGADVTDESPKHTAAGRRTLLIGNFLSFDAPAADDGSRDAVMQLMEARP